MINKKMMCLLAFTVLLSSSAIFANEKSLTENPIISKFIDQMVKKDKFDRKELIALFDGVKTYPEIIEKMKRPAEAWPWHRYRKIFIKDKRIEQGVEFWNEHEALLIKAEKEFGVSAQVIVGILGVETRFGRRTGNFRVIDALTTITVDYPRRSRYFKKELRQLLLLAREEKIDPVSFLGSYAGAMGKAQFMPSSYRHYAVDFNRDGRRDLIGNTADAIGSIASYLSEHGWKSGQPVTARANIAGSKYRKFLSKGMKPKVKLSNLKQYDITTDLVFSPDAKVSLIELEQKDTKEYWLGLTNFYAITRYNHSNLYAMAVHQLSEAIKDKRKKNKIAGN